MYVTSQTLTTGVSGSSPGSHESTMGPLDAKRERVEHETGIGRHHGSQGIRWSPQGP